MEKIQTLIEVNNELKKENEEVWMLCKTMCKKIEQLQSQLRKIKELTEMFDSKLCVKS